MIFPGFALGSELGWGSRIGGPEPSSLNMSFAFQAQEAYETLSIRRVDDLLNVLALRQHDKSKSA